MRPWGPEPTIAGRRSPAQSSRPAVCSSTQPPQTAKGSVCRKRDRKNDTITGEDGKPRQIERAGTESKAETERMMRKAMDDYENRLFVTQASNLTLAEAIDMWIEEGLKPSFLANGAVHQFDQGQQK